MDLLSLVRLNVEKVDEALAEKFYPNSAYEDFQAVSNGNTYYYNELMHACGYHSSLLRNLIIISGIFVCIMGIWILIACKDILANCCCTRTRHEPWLNNLLIRFLNEVFFEVCICLMLSLTIVDFKNTKNSWEWGVSIVLATISLVCLCLLSLLCFKNGPYVNDAYEPKSLWNSFWHFRIIRSDHLDIQNWISNLSISCNRRKF